MSDKRKMFFSIIRIVIIITLIIFMFVLINASINLDSKTRNLEVESGNPLEEDTSDDYSEMCGQTVNEDLDFDKFPIGKNKVDNINILENE